MCVRSIILKEAKHTIVWSFHERMVVPVTQATEASSVIGDFKAGSEVVVHRKRCSSHQASTQASKHDSQKHTWIAQNASKRKNTSLLLFPFWRVYDNVPVSGMIIIHFPPGTTGVNELMITDNCWTMCTSSHMCVLLGVWGGVVKGRELNGKRAVLVRVGEDGWNGRKRWTEKANRMIVKRERTERKWRNTELMNEEMMNELSELRGAGQFHQWVVWPGNGKNKWKGAYKAKDDDMIMMMMMMMIW